MYKATINSIQYHVVSLLHAAVKLRPDPAIR